MKSIHSRGDQKHACSKSAGCVDKCLSAIRNKKENQRKKFLTSRKTTELAAKY